MKFTKFLKTLLREFIKLNQCLSADIHESILFINVFLKIFVKRLFDPQMLDREVVYRHNPLLLWDFYVLGRQNGMPSLDIAEMSKLKENVRMLEDVTFYLARVNRSIGIDEEAVVLMEPINLFCKGTPLYIIYMQYWDQFIAHIDKDIELTRKFDSGEISFRDYWQGFLNHLAIAAGPEAQQLQALLREYRALLFLYDYWEITESNPRNIVC